MSIDLAPYGINLVLRKGLELKYVLGPTLVKRGTITKSSNTCTFPSGTYKITTPLGKGTYGESFILVDKDDKKCALKSIKIDHTNPIENTLKECIMNIILEKESENELYGPYVPRFYEVAYDIPSQRVLIRMELMVGTLGSMYYGSPKEQNDKIVPLTLANLAHILDFYYKRLQFNHRDLKSNNVMYTIGDNGEILVKLIDFGFTCLTWNKMKIEGDAYFKPPVKCFLPTRDLTQFVYEIHTSYADRFSTRLNDLLKETLTFDINGDLCQMYKKCSKYGMDKWLDTYKFLNNKKIMNPKCKADVLEAKLMSFMGLPDKNVHAFMSKIYPVKHICKPEDIMNPKSGKCVSRKSKSGKRLGQLDERRSPSPSDIAVRKARRRMATMKLKPCKEGQVRDPATRRCRSTRKKGRKPTAELKPCREGQVRNPETRRCRKPVASKAKKTRKHIPSAKLKPCKAGQVRNPVTRRCKKEKV